MYMDDLWFDVAIRGEHDLERELIVRLHLSDGAEPSKGEGPEVPLPALESHAALRQAPTVDFC